MIIFQINLCAPIFFHSLITLPYLLRFDIRFFRYRSKLPASHQRLTSIACGKLHSLCNHSLFFFRRTTYLLLQSVVMKFSTFIIFNPSLPSSSVTCCCIARQLIRWISMIIIIALISLQSQVESAAINKKPKSQPELSKRNKTVSTHYHTKI